MWAVLLGWCLVGAVRADRPPSPFGVTGTLEPTNGQTLVRFQFKVPPEHVL